MGAPEVPGPTRHDAHVVTRERFRRDGWLHPAGAADPPARARVRSLLLGAARDLRSRSAGLRHR